MRQWLKIHTGKSLREKIFFRVSHPLIPTLMFGALAALWVGLAQTYHGFSTPVLLGALAAGLFLWTLIEYCLHRFVFHFTPNKEPWRTLFAGLHLDHHRETQNPGLIIAPPTVALIDSAIIFGILYLITFNWALVLVLMAGIDIGYICYEWVHYGTHQYPWNQGLLGFFKRNHFHHHFQQPKEAYGVTSPLWDYIFRTHS